KVKKSNSKLYDNWIYRKFTKVPQVSDRKWSEHCRVTVAIEETYQEEKRKANAEADREPQEVEVQRDETQELE
ncbi:hypothetical protein PENTCL1PPCAC_10752, partial [Pristionchus entomophagus]